LDAIIRGAYEEIRLSATSQDLVASEKVFHPHNNMFRQTYFIVCTEEQKTHLVAKKGEVAAIEWVSVLDLKKMIEENSMLYSNSLPKVLHYREQYKKDIIAVLEARNAQQ
jgi:isopentenyldiphosphate isomerase